MGRRRWRHADRARRRLLSSGCDAGGDLVGAAGIVRGSLTVQLLGPGDTLEAWRVRNPLLVRGDELDIAGGGYPAILRGSLQSERDVAVASPVAPALLRKVCDAAPCSAPYARVQVWRTKTGEVARLVHRGEITIGADDPCFDASNAYFDETGARLVRIEDQSNRYADDAEERERRLESRRESFSGLVVGEDVECGSS